MRASEQIWDIIASHKLNRIMVIVCRWYGGHHLYEKRWRLISQCTLQVLGEVEMIPKANISNNQMPKQSKSPRPTMPKPESGTELITVNTLYITDSTAKGVDINRMLLRKSSKRYQAPTLDTAKTNYKMPDQPSVKSSSKLVLMT